MSLEGNLTSFGLSEIIQLIAVQQKTGMLSVTRQASSVKIYFREGRIISTRDRRKGAPDPLKEYLVRYGILSSAEISRLSELSARSKLDLTDVILSEGLMTEEELRRHCRSHIQESMYEILTWEQCSYKFVAGSQVIEGVRALSDLMVEGLLMESMRWIDEFPLMLQEFPHGEAIVRRKEGSKPADDISRHESALLELLESETSIDHLVSRAKLPRFETYESLRLLKEKGLIELEERPGSSDEPRKVEPARKRKRAYRRKSPLPLAAAIVLFAACGAWGARGLIGALEQKSTARRAGVALLNQEREQIAESLRWCLEIYKAKYGSYPQDLAALESSKVAPHSFFRRAAPHSFHYHLTPGGTRYILL